MTPDGLKAPTNWGELSTEASHDRRKERRIPLAFPIEVSGFDTNGKFFAERSVTMDISENGCKFQLKSQVERSSVLALKVFHRNGSGSFPERPLLFRVARVIQEDDGWTLGAVKLQPESIWCVAFPSPKKDDKPAA
jgi:hypothetical protein